MSVEALERPVAWYRGGRKLSQRQMDYQEFLHTPAWKRLSLAAITRDGECLECGSLKRLQAHHWRYPARVEDTTLNDLRTLCRTCHRYEHGLRTRTAFEWAEDGVSNKLMAMEDVSDLEFVRLIWLAFGVKFWRRSAIALARLYRQVKFKENWDTAQVYAERLAVQSENYDGEETELGEGDLIFKMQETYPRKRIKIVFPTVEGGAA